MFRRKWTKRALGMGLSAAMALSLVPGIAMTSLAEEVATTEDSSNESSGGTNVLNASDWSSWTQWDGLANFSNVTGDGFTVEVLGDGEQDWSIQYVNENLNMVEGHKYILSGDFYSDTDAAVHVNLQESLGWSSLLSNSPSTIEIKAGETTHMALETGEASGAFLTNGKIALMFGNGLGNTGKTITVSNLKLIDVTESSSEEEEIVSSAPSYTITGENLATGVEAKHEDWVEWSSCDITNLDNGYLFDITGYEGYEAYQTRAEASGITLEEGKNYVITFEIASNKDKYTMVRIDDLNNGYAKVIDDFEYSIAANKNNKVTIITGTLGSTIENARVFAGLGMVINDDAYKAGEHKVQITNLEVHEIEEDLSYGGYVDEGKTVKVEAPTTGKGAEYDFTSDNSAYDMVASDLSKAGYDLIWNDEFDGNYGSDTVDASTGLDLDNWSYQLGDGSTDCGNYGWGNNELESYTANSKNVAVNEDLDGDGEADGLLRITASYEEDGYYYASESKKNYTSARIRTTSSTEALFDTTYGYIEARISLPETQGAWPAFWMLPESTEIYGNWPVSGEIDILETTGVNTDSACGTLHWGTPSHVYKGSGYVNLDSEIKYFHTYAINWEPGQIEWIYDGEVIYTATNWESGIAGASDSLSFDAPFDEPFYMILNLAVDSGQFGGSANKASFKDDINMYVDYVRCYQKTDGYADTAVRSASTGSKSDWADYAKINQIAEITADNLDTVGGGHDDAAALGSNKWYLSTQTDAAATATMITDENGKVWDKVSITTPGSQDYSVQLIGHYDAKQGYVYKVSFDAYADGNLVGQTVNCDSKEYRGWSTYGITTLGLTAEPSSYSYVFEQTEDFDNCRIEFNIGAQGTGNVYISNVKVEIVDPAELSAEAEAHATLSDGNVLYNGSFDEGNDHFGYWTAADGTSVSIPRYTTEKIADGDVSVVDVASKTNYENIADGIKYYERRAEISADENTAPTIYQAGFKMLSDEYTFNYDLYSKEDTKITVAVYSTKEENGVTVLDQKLVSKTKSYSAADGLVSKAMTLTLDETVENAAVVISFSKGSSVLLDNVAMYGASQAAAIDETPLNSGSTWTGDNGGGVSLALTEADGTYTLSNVTSGGSWYSPQIISNNFSLVAGKEYTLSFKYKMSGTSNNTLQYIIQENSGSWYVYNDGPTTVTYDETSADEDGYCTYSVSFIAGNSLDTVHMVFGLGNSAAVGDLNFSYRDVALNLVKANVDAEEDEDVSEDPSEPSEDDDTPGTETGDENTPGTDEGNSDDDNQEEQVDPSTGEDVNTPGEGDGTDVTTPDESEDDKTIAETVQEAVQKVVSTVVSTVVTVVQTVVKTVTSIFKKLFGRH